MAEGGIRVKSFRIRELDALCGLDDPDDYLWEFRDGFGEVLRQNSAGTPDDLAIVVAFDGPRVIGRVGLVAGRAAVSGEPELIHWVRGFFLKDGYHGTGVGGLMLMALIRHHRHLIASGGPSAEAQALYRAGGFLELPRLERHVMFLSARQPLEKLLRSGAIARIASPFVSPLLRLGYRLLSWRIASPETGRTLASWRPTVRFADAAANGLIPDPCASFPRTVEDLDWLLASVPSLIPLRLDGAEGAGGYAILNDRDMGGAGAPHGLPRMRVLCILDYALRESGPATVDALLDATLAIARRRAVDVIEWQVMDLQVARALRRRGMIRIGGNRVFYRPTRPKRFDATGRTWYYTHAVADVGLPFAGLSIGSFRPAAV